MTITQEDLEAAVADAVKKATEEAQAEIDKHKSKADTLLGETKAAKAKAREIENEARQQREEKAQRDNDFEELYKSSSEKAREAEERLVNLQSQVRQKSIYGEASRIAATLTKDTARASLLAEKLAKRIDERDDGFKVLSESGELTGDSLDALSAQVSTAYPFLVDGSGSTGGNAGGSNSSNGAAGLEAERTNFETWTPDKQMEFVQKGGKLI